MSDVGQAKEAERDPVCGMDVDPSTARHKLEHRGTTYYFCLNPGCLEAFKADPEKYLNPTHRAVPIDPTLRNSLRTAQQSVLASALGFSASYLQSQLQAGRTIADLVKEKGIDESALRSALRNSAQQVLDPAVRNGRLTQSQEDMVLHRIEAGHGHVQPTPQRAAARAANET